MSITTSEMTPADIAAVTGNNDGFGGNNAWWFILLILLGWGGRGFGGYGNGSGINDNYTLTSDFSQLSKQISDTYNMTDRKFEGIANGLCSGFYQEAQLVNGVNTNMANGFFGVQNAITQAQIADMQGFNGINAAIKDCCCQTQQNVKDVNYNLATQGSNLARQISDSGYTLNSAIDKGFCQTNYNNSNNTRDIIASQHSDADRIIARLDAMENARIREQLEAARANNIALQGQLDRAKLRTDIVNDVRPCPIPAYPTCNPWASTNNSCCGCTA